MTSWPLCSMRLLVLASLISEAYSACFTVGGGVVAPVATWGSTAATSASTMAAVTGGSMTAGTAAAGTAAAGAAAAGAAAGTAAAGTAAAGAAAAGTAAATGAAGTGATSAMTAFTGGASMANGAVGFTAAAGMKTSFTAGLASMAATTWSVKKIIGATAAFGLTGLLLGAEANEIAVTWDCWKPIVHEKSLAPSRGRLLADILNHPAISEYRIGQDVVFLRNRWNESWRIDPVVLPWGQVAAHASQMMSTSGNSSADMYNTRSKLHSMNMTEART
eukprot:TRINITY_DN1464_c0_g1_i1.p1 TRINITY_DN1464_c0_g1~~TRINITY_DN1464_c0_g1_i1.p1  ORF type:complete len:276 (-),score=47.17 TRINITY_DN1464_c0_g1_i1:378-1205(-)